MKKKDINDLKNKTAAELDKLASDLRDQITKTQMEIKMRKTKNTNLAGNSKHDLARILSFKREKELYANS